MKVVLSLSRLNFLCVFVMRKCYRSSIIAASSWMIVFAFTLIRALCLSVIDDLHISVRHLRRRLSGLQLYRRRQYSDPERVVNFIASQLEGPGCLHGYRMMHERCRLNGLWLTRAMVREIQIRLGSIRCGGKKGRRLRRRRYGVPGP